MTTYELQFNLTRDVLSFLISANGSGVINNIVFDNDDDGEMLPLNEVAYPIVIGSGKKLVTLTKPVSAKRIELLGFGLECILGVSVNDTTLGDELQSKIDNVQDQVNNIIAGNIAFIHSQDVPAAIWTINHSLGYHPNVTVVDSAGDVVEGNKSYPSNSQIVIEFTGAFAGKAYLS